MVSRNHVEMPILMRKLQLYGKNKMESLKLQTHIEIPEPMKNLYLHAKNKMESPKLETQCSYARTHEEVAGLW